jgi:hypothetical protein
MSITAIEGIVSNGHIQLKGNMRLPDKTRVYVVVPDTQDQSPAHIYSPRLAHREEADDFVLEMDEGTNKGA